MRGSALAFFWVGMFFVALPLVSVDGQTADTTAFPPVYPGRVSATPLVGVSDGIVREYLIPPEAVLREILNKPRILHSHVSQEREDSVALGSTQGSAQGSTQSVAQGNAHWIDLAMDIIFCTELPIDSLRSILKDYINYPSVFKRYLKTEERSDATGMYQYITVGISLMGFSYNTFYILLSQFLADSPDTFVMTWVHAGDDGTIRNIRGSWHLASCTLDGRPVTFLRYTSTSTALRKFPLQRFIMNMFADQEHRDMINQLVSGASHLQERIGR